MIFNKIKELKKQGLKIGITFSTFDLLHAGHIAMLSEAKNHCDYLIAGLQTDPTIDRPDTKNKPIQSIVERQIQLSATRFVDEIVVYSTEQDLIDLLSEKNVNEMTNKDFTDIELEATVNGYLDLDELVWDKPKPSKKLLDDENFDFNDLYNTGEITDSEYEFVGPDSLFVELRNDRDSLHISEDGYKFIKGPRVKRWTKKNQEEFQEEYISTVNKLAQLHDKYELIIEEGLTENLPDVTEEVIREVRFKFDGVKAEIDSVYKSWHDEPLEITITNEVGAKFIAEISGIKDMIRLRNELIKRIDKLLCANGGASESVVDEAWEPEQPENNWDDDDSDLDPYGSADSIDDDNDVLQDDEDLS